MSNMKITFLGSGNIARAIIKGLIANGTPTTEITAADPMKSALDEAGKLGINVTMNNQTATRYADVIIISVKPNVVTKITKEIASIVGEKLVISVAAGITSQLLQESLGAKAHVIRCMPNTPAQIQSGITGLFATAVISKTEQRIAEKILGAVGKYVWVNEEAELHAVTAVSGSGPAYFFYIIEALQKAAIQLGLSENLAKLLVIETAIGAAKMTLTETTKTADTLRREVTSPGGTTEAAINILEQGDLVGLLSRAVESANARSIELARDIT